MEKFSTKFGRDLVENKNCKKAQFKAEKSVVLTEFCVEF